ncbi:MAG: hypothetical protein V4773_30775 [Verrucomicrobiota bacterium]
MKILVPLLLALLVSVARAADTESQVQAVFAELKQLAPMKQGVPYTLPASGEEVAGYSDDFLRRRTAQDIQKSKLSCGCGDYAIFFIQQMKARGFETLMVDSAQLSLVSLIGNFAGHAVAAIRQPKEPNSPWWLVDSTARKIISREWSVTEKSFTASGIVYWIGYCGPLEKYPVQSPDELKDFYRQTLTKVPVEVLDHNIKRLVFTVDSSLKGDDGKYLNPRLDRLTFEQNRVFSRYRIKPKQEIPILLVRGGNDANGNLEFTDDRWTATVGLQSACSPSFLANMERKIQSEERRSGGK